MDVLVAVLIQQLTRDDSPHTFCFWRLQLTVADIGMQIVAVLLHTIALRHCHFFRFKFKIYKQNKVKKYKPGKEKSKLNEESMRPNTVAKITRPDFDKLFEGFVRCCINRIKSSTVVLYKVRPAAKKKSLQNQFLFFARK